MLVDLLLPPHTMEFVRVVGGLIALGPNWQPVDPYDSPCPAQMVLVGKTCVDEFPYPNTNGDEVLLGVSAIPESYLESKGATWDCVALCQAEGKRVCRWREWQAACEGTPVDACGELREWLVPNWHRVMLRSPSEMRRLDQHALASHYPRCVSDAGVRMMTTVEEWVQVGNSFAFTRGFWSRPGGCHDLNASHSPAWHGYSNACRCCQDAQP